MHCFICDSMLTEDTISWNHQHGDWDPCPDCLRVIDEVFNTSYDEEQITQILMDEFGDPDEYEAIENTMSSSFNPPRKDFPS